MGQTETGGAEETPGTGNNQKDKTPAGLTGLQFTLAIILIAAVVLVAWYLISRNLVDKTNSSLFYSSVIEGLIILGAAFFGIPLSWREGRKSGEAEGKAEGEQDKQKALTDQRKAIGAKGKALITQANSGQQRIQDTIEEIFSSSVGSRDIRLAREDLGDRVVTIEMDQLRGTREALVRLDQFMSDLEAGA